MDLNQFLFGTTVSVCEVIQNTCMDLRFIISKCSPAPRILNMITRSSLCFKYYLILYLNDLHMSYFSFY